MTHFVLFTVVIIERLSRCDCGTFAWNRPNDLARAGKGPPPFICRRMVVEQDDLCFGQSLRPQAAHIRVSLKTQVHVDQTYEADAERPIRGRCPDCGVMTVTTS